MLAWDIHFNAPEGELAAHLRKIDRQAEEVVLREIVY